MLIRFVPMANGEVYIPAEGDTIRFAMKRRYKDENTLIQKTIPTDTFLLELQPEETKPLAAGRGYVYDVELTDSFGRTDTYITGIVTLMEEVE